MAHDTPVKGSVSRDIKKKVDVGEGKKYLTCREKKKKKECAFAQRYFFSSARFRDLEACTRSIQFLIEHPFISGY